MKEFGHIFLSWRSGIGQPRHLVGKLKRNVSDGITFQYFPEKVRAAQADGFIPYTEFPEIDKVYKERVIETFGQRLIKSERNDISDFLKFWDIDEKYKDDKLYLLAHTQGLSPSDNFEFLADFNPTKKLRFTTDLASLTHLALPVNTLQNGDYLQVKKNPLPEDPKAVKVFKDNIMVGFIKRVHSGVFYKNGGRYLKVRVKSIEKNGVIKKIFVSVGFEI